MFTWSSLQILIDLKGFTCHWRFVTRSQQLCSKSFLLPDIKLSSFSLSRPLLQYFNRQASKRNNLAKGRVANVSLGVAGLHVTYAKFPSLGITVIINIFFIYFFGDQNFFMATILQLKVAKRRLFEKVSLERCVTPTLRPRPPPPLMLQNASWTVYWKEGEGEATFNKGRKQDLHQGKPLVIFRCQQLLSMIVGSNETMIHSSKDGP